jgi:hypothetical protein
MGGSKAPRSVAEGAASIVWATSPDVPTGASSETTSRSRGDRLLAGGPTPTLTLVLDLLALAGIPGQVAMPAEQLRQAVPGLAGLAGLVLFPTLGAWLRLLLEVIAWNEPYSGLPRSGRGRRSGTTQARRISGVTLVRASVFTLLLAFFLLTLLRAAGELREIHVEAPVVGPSLQGMAVGIVFWAFYALGISALRSEGRRRRTEHRVGRSLR